MQEDYTVELDVEELLAAVVAFRDKLKKSGTKLDKFFVSDLPALSKLFDNPFDITKAELALLQARVAVFDRSA